MEVSDEDNEIYDNNESDDGDKVDGDNIVIKWWQYYHSTAKKNCDCFQSLYSFLMYTFQEMQPMETYTLIHRFYYCIKYIPWLQYWSYKIAKMINWVLIMYQTLF